MPMAVSVERLTVPETVLGPPTSEQGLHTERRTKLLVVCGLFLPLGAEPEEKETKLEAGRSARPPAGGQVSGWVAFAGIAMVVLGGLDVLWGIAAIANNEVVVVGGHGVMIFDITAWGWIQLILGLVVLLTGFGLLVGSEIARVLGLFLLALNAVLQIVWFSAAPLWALLIIALDVVLIYQLTVNWAKEA
jgi:hypothetical protein